MPAVWKADLDAQAQTVASKDNEASVDWGTVSRGQEAIHRKGQAVSLPPAQWALLMPNGEVVMGSGDGPNGNVCGLMREAVAAMFCFADLPRLFICGPALVKCATDIGMTIDGGPIQVKRRVWSFGNLVGVERRLFVWSSGAVIGIGRTQEEVGRAVDAIQAACRAKGAPRA